MSTLTRVAAIPLVFGLVAGCVPSSASPTTGGETASPTAGATALPTASLTPSPTATPTPTATPAPTAAATAVPTVAPTFSHGEYLLVRRQESSFEPTASEILVRPDGSGYRVFAKDPTPALLSPAPFGFQAVWSRGGRTVHLTNGCDPKIWEVSPLGGSPVLKLTMTDHDTSFARSPDDLLIAYGHYTRGAIICGHNTVDHELDLMVMKADGSSRRVVRSDVGDLKPVAWWPSGTVLLAYDYTNWYAVQLASGALSPLGISGTEVTISPSGGALAWLSGGHVKARATIGGPVKDFGVGNSFRWSPNSNSLAIGGTTLRIVNVTTSASVTVYAGAAARPTWRPDGMRLAFVKSGQVFWIDAAGGPAIRVPGVEKAVDVEWQP